MALLVRLFGGASQRSLVQPCESFLPRLQFSSNRHGPNWPTRNAKARQLSVKLSAVQLEELEAVAAPPDISTLADDIEESLERDRAQRISLDDDVVPDKKYCQRCGEPIREELKANWGNWATVKYCGKRCKNAAKRQRKRRGY